MVVAIKLSEEHVLLTDSYVCPNILAGQKQHTPTHLPNVGEYAIVLAPNARLAEWIDKFTLGSDARFKGKTLLLAKLFPRDHFFRQWYWYGASLNNEKEEEKEKQAAIR